MLAEALLTGSLNQSSRASGGGLDDLTSRYRLPEFEKLMTSLRSTSMKASNLTNLNTTRRDHITPRYMSQWKSKVTLAPSIQGEKAAKI